MEELPTCPFCGEPPETGKIEHGSCFYVDCANTNCPAMPTVVGATQEIANERWSRRAQPQQEHKGRLYKVPYADEEPPQEDK